MLKQNYYIGLYEITINRKYSKKNKENYIFDQITNIQGNSQEKIKFVDVLQNVFDTLEPKKCPNEDKIIKVNINKEYSKNDIICGYIYYGKDRNDKKKYQWNNLDIVEDITSNEIVAEKYYFMLKTPNNQDRGALVIERKGASGILTVFKRLLRYGLKQFPDYRHIGINFNQNKFPKENKIFVEEGKVMELIYENDKISENIAGKEEKGITRVTIKFEEEKNIDEVKKLFLKPLKKISKKIKIKVKHGENKRTLDLEELNEIFPAINVTSKLEDNGENEDNNITIDSWNKVSEEIINNNFDDIWRNTLT